jgi:hypothetical protein
MRAQESWFEKTRMPQVKMLVLALALVTTMM